MAAVAVCGGQDMGVKGVKRGYVKGVFLFVFGITNRKGKREKLDSRGEGKAEEREMEWKGKE